MLLFLTVSNTREKEYLCPHFFYMQEEQVPKFLCHPVHVCLQLSVGQLIADGPRQHSKSWFIFLFLTSLLRVLKWGLLDDRLGLTTTGPSASGALFAAVGLLMFSKIGHPCDIQ
jgi:hypothetical protein